MFLRLMGVLLGFVTGRRGVIPVFIFFEVYFWVLISVFGDLN